MTKVKEGALKMRNRTNVIVNTKLSLNQPKKGMMLQSMEEGGLWKDL